ncbi:FMN-binding protein [Spirochaeta dissipatitropha]
MKQSQKRTTPAIAVTLLIAAIAITLTGCGTIEVELNGIDLSSAQNGHWEGIHEAFPVSAEVLVQIMSHSITNIEIIRHDNGRGSAAESIVERVIAEQDTRVDAISGATSSSNVILKAIERAVEKAVSHTE